MSLDNLNAEIVDDFEHMLVALLDEQGSVLSLGITQSVNFGAGLLNITCKAGIVDAARVIQFGTYRMNNFSQNNVG